MAFGPAPLPSIGLLYDPTVYEPGLFYLRGYKAELLYGRKLLAEHSEYTIGGQDATLTKATPTPINAGPLPPFTYLIFGASGVYVMQAETGSYTLTGKDAALRKGLGLTGETVVWTISVAPAQRDIDLTAAPRLFQMIGQDATMTWARGLTGAYGSYTLTGQEAGYVLISGPDRSMSADHGRFYINLIDKLPVGVGYENATLIYTRQLQCDAGVFTFTGQSATLDGPIWSDVSDSSGTWTYVTPSGGVWIDVDPDS